jgi:DNA-directed RNA polymerase subunit RPC12/RpoP
MKVDFENLQNETLESLKEYIEDYTNDQQMKENFNNPCTTQNHFQEKNVLPNVRLELQQTKQEENFQMKEENNWNNEFNFLNMLTPTYPSKWNVHQSYANFPPPTPFHNLIFDEKQPPKILPAKEIKFEQDTKKRILENEIKPEIKKRKLEPLFEKKNELGELEKKPESKKFTITIEIMTLEKSNEDEMFHCDTCNKGYKDRSNLTKHLRTHTKEKPYICEVCGKEFSHSQSKKDHMSIHKQEKPYPCPSCHLSFGNGSNLRRHVSAIHEKEKPHECPHCKQKFSQKANLKNHLSKNHKNKFI